MDPLPPLQGGWLSEKIILVASVTLRFHNWDSVEDQYIMGRGGGKEREEGNDKERGDSVRCLSGWSCTD